LQSFLAFQRLFQKWLICLFGERPPISPVVLKP